MKERFLNLNHFAGKILALLALLLIGIPLAGWIIQIAGLQSPLLAWLVRASLWAGGTLLLVFLLLILLEQILDAHLYRRYRRDLNRRIPLRNGLAECPHCGYRHLRPFHTACPACGQELVD